MKWCHSRLLDILDPACLMKSNGPAPVILNQASRKKILIPSEALSRRWNQRGQKGWTLLYIHS